MTETPPPAPTDARGFKPTPGPWRWESPAPEADPGYIDACLESDWGGIVYHSASWPVHGPDARLIAAAPDLLAACKAALGAFEHNHAIDWDDLVRAIAKAEGRDNAR